MRKTAVVIALSLATAALLAGTVDPAAAIQKARQSIDAKQYAAAVDELNGALEAARSLPEAERRPAIAAIHFYSAIALSGMQSDDEAKAHLVEFFALTPNARITSDKFDPQFVALFNEVQSRGEKNADFRFDNVYRGFTTAVAPTADDDPTTWGISPALQILASRREKQEWAGAIAATDRATFIEGFWKKRDPTPDTAENEFRETFDRRAVFADKVFESPDGRGATSDRGRVFILLGPPSSVRRRPLTHRDPVVIHENQPVNGFLEQWVYGKHQLPIRVPRDSVTYRFVTQKGIGEGVLQQEDPYAFQALMVAMNPNEHKKK